MSGMNELETLLAKDAGKRTLFMCHLIAGYPTQAQSEAAAHALIKGGADILEVQIPFSDPMADGPTIAAACRDALAAGASVKRTLALVAKLSRGVALVVITNFSIPYRKTGLI
jgi:tryptophan synthase alpha chain